MPKLAQPQNPLVFLNAKPKEADYVISDGRGLGLLVKTTGAKYWIYRYRLEGKNQKIMLQGPFPETSLAQAREEAAMLRKYVNAGINPSEERREQKQMAPPKPRPRIPKTPPKRYFEPRETKKCDITFEDAAEEWIKAHYSDASQEEQTKIRRRVNYYLRPKFDLVAISKITTHDIFVLEFDIAKKKNENTAKAIRNLCLQILRWSLFRHETSIEKGF